jgi:hypothetical protein
VSWYLDSSAAAVAVAVVCVCVLYNCHLIEFSCQGSVALGALDVLHDCVAFSVDGIVIKSETGHNGD